jgi:hypothetical protein
MCSIYFYDIRRTQSAPRIRQTGALNFDHHTMCGFHCYEQIVTVLLNFLPAARDDRAYYSAGMQRRAGVLRRHTTG